MLGENLLRTGFFVPNLIGGIILGLVWRFIFSNVLVFLGRTLNIGFLSTSWLANPNKALWTLVIVTVWQYSGYMMIIFIAGLSNIPKELLEAATIDGATGFQRLRTIVLPLMVPAFIVTVFLTIQRGFMVYDVNIALTNGGPFKSTQLISMFVYEKAFLSQQYGVGQSEAFFLFFLVAVISLTQVYFTKSWRWKCDEAHRAAMRFLRHAVLYALIVLYLSAFFFSVVLLNSFKEQERDCLQPLCFTPCLVFEQTSSLVPAAWVGSSAFLNSLLIPPASVIGIAVFSLHDCLSFCAH